MKIKNDQAGLTLVELLVTIVVASIVTLAACTMLLFGLRINNQSTKTSMGQNTVQVLMEALEDVAAEAKDLNVESDADSWAIKDGTQTLFSYESAHQTIYTGMAPTQEYEVGIPFLKGIFASSVTYEDQLLTIDVQITEEDNYSTSIYCRMGQTEYEQELSIGEKLVKFLNGDESFKEEVSGLDYAKEGTRNTFLKMLTSQYDSKGKIIGTSEDGKYYATWYQENKSGTTGDWGKDTAWCACYVSWALVNTEGISNPLMEANVETLRNVIIGANKLQSTTKPTPGDLVFFNFDEDAQSDHVGVVLLIHEGYLYTIEGNTAGKVAVRKYSANYDAREVDPRIIEYGKILG